MNEGTDIGVMGTGVDDNDDDGGGGSNERVGESDEGRGEQWREHRHW